VKSWSQKSYGDQAGVILSITGLPPSRPLGVFTLAFAPWSAEKVLRCPIAALPAQGQLSVRDVRLTTRMGRTVRFLIPAFTVA
jgi:hypothetical protein